MGNTGKTSWRAFFAAIGRSEKTAAFVRRAYAQGLQSAVKEAALGENVLTSMLHGAAPYLVPAGLGAAIAGEGHRAEGAAVGLGAGLAGKWALKNLGKAYTLNAGERAAAKGLSQEALDALALKDRALASKLRSYQTNLPAMEWAGRIGGGALGGLGVKKFIGADTPPNLGTAPTITDMGAHYTGLTPEDLLLAGIQQAQGLEQFSPSEEIGV